MICPKCGAENSEGSKFCGSCGTPVEVPVQEEPKVISPNEAVYTRYGEEPKPINQNNASPVTSAPAQQPYGTQPQQAQAPYGQNATPYYQNVPQQPKKKNKGCLVAILVVVILFVISIFVLSLFGFIAKRYSVNLGDKDVDIVIWDDYRYKPVSGEEYTKGVLEDGVYENKWADFKLVVPSGYENLSVEDYARFESEGTECGLYIENDNYDSLAVIFTYAADYGDDYDVKDYVNDVAETIEENYKKNNENTITLTTLNDDSSFADKQFYSKSVTATKENITAVDTLYGCKIGDYYCILWMTGDTETYNNDFVENIVKVSE